MEYRKYLQSLKKKKKSQREPALKFADCLAVTNLCQQKGKALKEHSILLHFTKYLDQRAAS